MTSKRRTFLQIPQGTEGFFLEEAFRHRRVISLLDRLFESWGYLPVHTPVFDFFDNYRTLLTDAALDKVYRLIDREGDLLMLRSDITLFLAKQMGLALTKADLPVRVYYSDVILRHQNREDISRNEFFQAGVELIGKGAGEADLEVMVLLIRTFAELGLPAILHFGSRALFDRLFGELEEEARKNLAEAITIRDRATTVETLRTWDRSLVDFVVELFEFIGDAEDLRRLSSRARKVAGLPKGTITEINRLVEISRTLGATTARANHRIDLSEIGTQPYYTGIVFQAYLQGQDAAVASGGRYDGLLGFFGFRAPSIGFSLLLRKVEPLTSMHERIKLPASELAKGGTFEEKLRAADALRKTGRIPVL